LRGGGGVNRLFIPVALDVDLDLRKHVQLGVGLTLSYFTLVFYDGILWGIEVARIILCVLFMLYLCVLFMLPRCSLPKVFIDFWISSHFF
jgi:hypothetical protein